MNVCFHITYQIVPELLMVSAINRKASAVVLEQHLREWDITVCKKPLVIMDKYVIIDTLMSDGDG